MYWTSVDERIRDLLEQGHCHRTSWIRYAFTNLSDSKPLDPAFGPKGEKEILRGHSSRSYLLRRFDPRAS